MDVIFQIIRYLSHENLKKNFNNHQTTAILQLKKESHITSHHNVPLGMIVISSLDELQKFAILLAEYTI